MAVALVVEPLYVDRHAPRRPSAAVYARRRLVAGLLAVVALASLVTLAGQVAVSLGGVSASAPERSAPAPRTVVVEPGDTLWSLARQLQPEGDVRPLVRALVRANGGTAYLEVGTRIAVP